MAQAGSPPRFGLGGSASCWWHSDTRAHRPRGAQPPPKPRNEPDGCFLRVCSLALGHYDFASLFASPEGHLCASDQPAKVVQANIFP